MTLSLPALPAGSVHSISLLRSDKYPISKSDQKATSKDTQMATKGSIGYIISWDECGEGEMSFAGTINGGGSARQACRVVSYMGIVAFKKHATIVHVYDCCDVRSIDYCPEPTRQKSDEASF